MSIIRKISVGVDFPNRVMHYQVGKEMTLMGEPFVIAAIMLEEVYKGKMGYNIYLEGDDSTILWKQVVDMPVHIEFDITFD